MPPTLLLIRHAQAEHNVTDDWTIRDAPLTELGKQQCLELQESLKNSEIGNKVERIVVSAQRRTLQTATIGLDYLIKKGIQGNSTHSISLHTLMQLYNLMKFPAPNFVSEML
jgi:broad specificity phosphatase PhoE